MSFLYDNKFFFSAYQIFIKGVNHISDEEILSWVGITDYEFIPVSDNDYQNFNTDQFEEHLYITECSEWKHILDDACGYFLYNKHLDLILNQGIDVIKQIGEKYNVLSCSNGDATDDYEIIYYKDGKLKRKFKVDCYDWVNLEVTEDYGEPLPGENKKIRQDFHLPYLMSVVESMGININHDLQKIRLYAKKDKN